MYDLIKITQISEEGYRTYHVALVIADLSELDGMDGHFCNGIDILETIKFNIDPRKFRQMRNKFDEMMVANNEFVGSSFREMVNRTKECLKEFWENHELCST